MGSFAFITINDYLVNSTKNYFDQWFFKKSDRIIVAKKVSQRNSMIWGEANSCEVDKIEQCYLYQVSARDLKRRLELAGWSCHSAKQEFIKSVRERLYEVEALEGDQFTDYRHHVSVLKTAKFEEWLIKLEQIITSKIKKSYEWEQTHYSDPILDILLNVPDYQRFKDDISNFDINWPCITFEGFVRAILEIVPEETPCILDVSDLIGGGWTEEFEDLIDHQRKYTTFYEVFDTAIGDIKKLMDLDHNNQTLSMLLYANTITAMETYLSDTIKKQIFMRPALLRRFVENQDDLKKEKVTVSELFNKMDTIKETVNEIIDKTTFHNLPIVIKIYGSVLDAHFPEKAIPLLTKAIKIRHDIVHRNGKRTNGEVILVTESDVEALVQLVLEVVQEIDRQVIDEVEDDI